MPAVPQGAVLSAGQPMLATWIADFYGFLCKPDSLTFIVFDVSTEEKELVPSTVFGPHAVDLTADLVPPYQDGRYAAAWSVSGSEPIGRHLIQWTAQITSTDQDGTATTRTATWTRAFDVLASLPVIGQPGYALVSDMRAEGVRESSASDARLIALIRDASIEFERLVGGRWFEPRYNSWKLDGTAKPQLWIEHPIVAIDSATVFGEGAIDPATYKIFNRHITGLTDPDDRASARLEYFVTQTGLQGPVQPLAYPYPIDEQWMLPKPWAKGTQNVTIDGVFGYTDPDGSPEGMTPTEVTRAVKLLVLRRLPRMMAGGGTSLFDAVNKHRLTSEKTREQSYQLAAGMAGKGAYTTDWEIDRIVEQYSKPPRFFAV